MHKLLPMCGLLDHAYTVVIILSNWTYSANFENNELTILVSAIFRHLQQKYCNQHESANDTGRVSQHVTWLNYRSKRVFRLFEVKSRLNLHCGIMMNVLVDIALRKLH